jgi:glucosamine--fructose-6-phosphate aminotransferase (isomerizing)
MCGIFGYVGSQNAAELCLKGLKRLEYRGYDSAGIAGGRGKELVVTRVAGKVAGLEAKILAEEAMVDYAIAHTRWATHGGPTEKNAHPHCNMTRQLAVVHNGIIENHASLKQQLESEGVVFQSETDTEVIPALIASVYEGDLLQAVQQVVPLLQGSFALAVVHKDFPEQIVAAANESPLLIGIGEEEAFLASDIHAFLTHTRDVLYLVDREVALITRDDVQIFNSSTEQVSRQAERVDLEVQEASKGEYDHFTLKEIFEQPQTIRNALLSRYVEETGTAVFEDLAEDLPEEALQGVERILILACGTSWHAGYVGSYLLEDMARIPTQVEISSEFRYKNPIVREGTLVIAISQSGETADTIAAVKELKAKGATIVSICNVHGSTMVRESHGSIFLRAGAEVGVCSTKAFTSQLVVFSLLTLFFGRKRNMSRQEGRKFIEAIKLLPDQVQRVLASASHIEMVAKRYSKFENFFFLGRRHMFPTALEAALKLKEISYINANGYPAGEMKHGPIALISESCPTVAFCANKMTYEKMLSNLKEVKARSGRVVAIATENAKGLEDIADDIITVPDVIDPLAPILTSVVGQLFAYYIARERGAEIDQPRNLAKSVSVE